MKNLFIPVVVLTLIAGFASCGNTGFREDLWIDPWDGKVLNYNGDDVTTLNPDAAALAGKWKAVNNPFSHTYLNGEILPIAYSMVALEAAVDWYFTFESSGEGRGLEHYKGLGPYGIETTVEYDFAWRLSGNELNLTHHTDLLHNSELETFIRDYGLKYGYAVGDIESKIASFMYGDRPEWIITELTADRLVLHYKEGRTMERYGKTWWRQWYIFEKVEN